MKTKNNPATIYAGQIGKGAIWTPKYTTSPSISGIKFEVEILNVQIFGGSPHYTIKPVAGAGQARVRDNLEFPETKALQIQINNIEHEPTNIEPALPREAESNPARQVPRMFGKDKFKRV